MPTPSRLIVTDLLTTDGLSALGRIAGSHLSNAVAAEAEGDRGGAEVHRHFANAWIGKRADLLAG